MASEDATKMSELELQVKYYTGAKSNYSRDTSVELNWEGRGHGVNSLTVKRVELGALENRCFRRIPAGHENQTV